MDESTSRSRIIDFFSNGLVISLDKNGDEVVISSASDIDTDTLIVGTAKLINSYDKHAYDTCLSLIKTAAQLGHNANYIIDNSYYNDRIINRLDIFFKEYDNNWGNNVKEFLKTTLCNEKALQLKARRHIMTYPYLHILMKSLIHRLDNKDHNNNYLFIDNFHSKIFEVTSVGMRSTAGYIKNMIQWKILERLQKKDGVKRNRYAVRITDHAFSHFTSTLAEAEPIIIGAVKDIGNICVS